MDCGYDPPTRAEGARMRREIYGGFGLAPVSAEVDFRVQAPEWSRAQLYYSQDYNVNEASRVVNDNINQMHYEFVAPLSAFLGILDYCSQAVGDSGYGRVNTIGHVGIKRFAAGVPSYHYAWKAIDLSYVHWEGGNISRPHSALKDVVVGGTGSSQAHRRLIAVEACLRSAFGYVLNRYIGRLSRPYDTTNAEGPNSEHFNHFHADNGCPVALIADRRNLANPTLGKRTVRSGHYFIQDCINAFTDRQIDYDGRWGAKTELGYLTLLRDMGMERLDPISYVSHYLLFLDFIIVHGLTDSRSGAYRWRDNPIEGGQSKWPL